MGVILAGVMIGLGGTVAMDLWALLLNRLFGQPMAQWGRVGRWVAHLPDRIFHDDIGKAAPVAAERAIGWAFHYAVGVVYGIVFALLAGRGWFGDPTFLPVWIFGILTIAAGWFLLQPGMGAGWAASRTPDPARARVLGLLAHTVFAFGMWAVALAGA